MKSTFIACLALISLTLSGCASTDYNLTSLAGINVRDLEAAKDQGRSRTFEMGYEDAFNRTIAVLEREKLTTFRSSKRKGYIVAMGFPEQIDTTRVGIFFDAVSENSTEITLSSLSGTAVSKAENIIFSGLAD